jgi:hypothetical protein
MQAYFYLSDLPYQEVSGMEFIICSIVAMSIDMIIFFIQTILRIINTYQGLKRAYLGRANRKTETQVERPIVTNQNAALVHFNYSIEV